MNPVSYPYEKSNDHRKYTFISAGAKGKFIKQVVFDEAFPLVYNIGLGDIDQETGFLSDVQSKNNGDRELILNTTLAIIQIFSNSYFHQAQ